MGRDPIEYSDGMNQFAFLRSRVATLRDPMGMACWMEIHHWFPDGLGPEIAAKCPLIANLLHVFGSPLPTCHGKRHPCNHHGWIHNNPRLGNYNTRVRETLKSSRKCRDFLKKMKNDIIRRFWHEARVHDIDCDKQNTRNFLISALSRRCSRLRSLAGNSSTINSLGDIPKMLLPY